MDSIEWTEMKTQTLNSNSTWVLVSQGGLGEGKEDRQLKEGSTHVRVQIGSVR